MGVDVLTRARRKLAPRNAVPNPPVGRLALAGGQGVPAPRGIGPQLEAMANVGTVFSVVNRIAEDVAAVDWHLYRGDDPKTLGPMEDRDEVLLHPALEVWNRPNPFYTQRLFVETIQQHADLTGEQWWIVQGVGARPAFLWPIRPDRMTPVPDPVKFITGYTLRSADGRDIPLGTDDVIYQRRPDPRDPYRGISPIGALAADLYGEHMASQWNAAFFANSARPDGILTTPEVLTDTEFARMQAHREEQHRGVGNAHRMMVLEGGTYSPAGFSQKDMDFVSLRGLTRAQVLEVYGFPEFMLGKTSGTNRATAWAILSMYAKVVLGPRLDVIREALNSELLPLFGGAGRGVVFDYGPPVPPDTEDERADLASRISAAQAMVAMGADPAEATGAFGLPAMSFAAPPTQVASPPTGPADDPDDTEQGDDRP